MAACVLHLYFYEFCGMKIHNSYSYAVKLRNGVGYTTQYINTYIYIPYNGYESPLLPQQTQDRSTSVVDRPRDSDHPRWPNFETARRPGSRRSLRASELEGYPLFRA